MIFLCNACCEFESETYHTECPVCGISGAMMAIVDPVQRQDLVRVVQIPDRDPAFVKATECVVEMPYLIHTGSMFDRVTEAGGVPLGVFMLVSGSEGAGKSYQARELATRWVTRRPWDERPSNALYCCYEERIETVLYKLTQHADLSPDLLLTEAPFCVDRIVTNVDAYRLVIVDSMQTATIGELTIAHSFPGTLVRERDDLGMPGSPKRCLALATEALALVREDPNTTCVVIAHETKDERIAGPKIIAHMCDIEIAFEVNIEEGRRSMLIKKNRYGPIGRFDL